MADFLFNNMDRIGVDGTQRNLSNTRYAEYTTDSVYGSDDSHVQFATSAPTINFRGASGAGLPGSSVDFDSLLMIKAEQQRAFEKLQLIQRPFATVPFLGRGAVDPALESQLRRGEAASERKSVSTTSETTHVEYPIMDSVRDRVTNPTYSVEESALDGWVRGGQASRASNFSK
jgi:hypothetical protein